MLRTTILQFDGSFNYPSARKGTRFLYYLSVYGNISKNSFLMPSFRKRVQRYCFFLNHQNFLQEIYAFYAEFLQLLISVKTKKNLHLIIYKKTIEDNRPDRTSEKSLEKVKEIFLRDSFLHKNLAVCRKIGNFAAEK